MGGFGDSGGGHYTGVIQCIEERLGITRAFSIAGRNDRSGCHMEWEHGCGVHCQA